MLVFMLSLQGRLYVYACVSALFDADVYVSFAEGNIEDCFQGHPDGSGLHHCRVTSTVPEPWPDFYYLIICLIRNVLQGSYWLF